MAEYWDLYNAQGQKTGRTMIRGEEVPRGLYHLAVHIWPYNDAGEILAQRRSAFVQWKPNIWAATGGSAVMGETPLTGALRELREELGYDALPDEMQELSFQRRSNSFCAVYLIRINRPASEFVLQKEEVGEVRWLTRERMNAMISEGRFYNYGDAYYRALWSKVESLTACT